MHWPQARAMVTVVDCLGQWTVTVCPGALKGHWAVTGNNRCLSWTLINRYGLFQISWSWTLPVKYNYQCLKFSFRFGHEIFFLNIFWFGNGATSLLQPATGSTQCQISCHSLPGHLHLVLSTYSSQAIPPLQPFPCFVHCRFSGHLPLVLSTVSSQALPLRPPHPSYGYFQFSGNPARATSP